VGRISLDQGIITGKLLVVNNKDKAFQIVKCTYDERVIHVSQAPFPNQPGFSLEVTPKMENIPPGSRIATVLTVETDVPSEGKVEVQVQAINLAETPR
jgi:hypothetical protein